MISSVPNPLNFKAKMCIMATLKRNMGVFPVWPRCPQAATTWWHKWSWGNCGNAQSPPVISRGLQGTSLVLRNTSAHVLLAAGVPKRMLSSWHTIPWTPGLPVCSKDETSGWSMVSSCALSLRPWSISVASSLSKSLWLSALNPSLYRVRH